MNISLAADASRSYANLKATCNRIEKKRYAEFNAQPLAKRVHHYACKALQNFGIAIGLISIPMAIIFSASFLLCGAAGFAIAALTAIKKVDRFAPFSLQERNFLDSVKLMNLNSKNLPIISKVRGFFDSDWSFLNLFLSKELQQKYEKFGLKSITPQEWKRTGIFYLYDVSEYALLLQSIQHVIRCRLDLLKMNAAKLEKIPCDRVIPTHWDVKMRILTQTLITPSKEFQERIQCEFAPVNGKQTFSLHDLDRVYEIAKTS